MEMKNLIYLWKRLWLKKPAYYKIILQNSTIVVAILIYYSWFIIFITRTDSDVIFKVINRYMWLGWYIFEAIALQLLHK